MVRFSPSIEQRNHFIIMIWMWHGVAIMNGKIAYVLTDRCLHGKAAEICLANS